METTINIAVVPVKGSTTPPHKYEIVEFSGDHPERETIGMYTLDIEHNTIISFTPFMPEKYGIPIISEYGINQLIEEIRDGHIVSRQAFVPID